MAIGFGPGSDAVRAVNKQRSERKKASLKENMDGYGSGENAQKPLQFKEATPEQIKAIREQMQAENKRNRIILSIVGGVIACIIIWLTIYIF